MSTEAHPATASPHQAVGSRFTVALAVIAAFAAIIRVLVVVIVDPQVPELGDASAYHLLANHLADGRGYIRPFDLIRFDLVVPTAEYPPLHPFVLSLFARLGLRSVEAQRLGLTAVGTTTVALVGLVGRQIGGTRVGLIAAALAAVSPMMFLPEATLMSEALFVFLVTLALYFAGRVRAAPSLGGFAGLGLVLGLAVLTRAEAGVLALLLVVPLAVRAEGRAPATRGRRVTFAAVGLLMVGAVVVPWTVRNQNTFDAFVPVSNNLGTALAGANCPLTYSGPTLGFWRSTFGSDDADSGQCFTGFNGRQPRFNEATAAGAARKEGVDFARDHLGDLPKVAVARLLRTAGVFRPSQQIELEALEGRPLGWERAGTYLDWVLYPFAAVGLVLLVRRRSPAWPLVAAVVSVMVSTLLTYGNQRFRIGAEPTLLITAATTFGSIGSWFGSRLDLRRRPTPRTDPTGS